ncbi:MAG: phosphotransferase [Bifidobacteriaceae bacterium]|jgi:Ser/Thr protein kinase RdoA (MazF antagonist)|nr:phosphotransferase [Bifidobacteriaceae bacterium]
MTIVAPERDAEPIQEPSLAAFDALRAGAAAPYWLFRGVAAAWCLDPERMDLRLITVSENATFLLSLDGAPKGAIRVSQPGYVGGPAAIRSEVAWVQALRDELPQVRLLEPVPSPRGPYAVVVRDNAGTGWVCVSTRFVAGAPLEDLPDPAGYYRTIGRWSALFHDHARHWRLPYGFKRFAWDIDDMVGPSCRWGRWEGVAQLEDAELALLTRAQERALAHLDSLPKNRGTWGLIHADLRPSNILADAGDLTVIDFDDCGFSYFLYDFAAALSFVEHEPYAPAMARAWVEGYQEIAPLSSQDLVHAGALSMIRRLQMLGWTDGHREDALPDGLYRAQLPGTVEVARRFAASPTWLID